MVRWLLLFTISLLINGCMLKSDFGVQDINSADSVNALRKIYFDVTSMNVSEGSAALVSVQMTDKLAVDTVIQLSISGDTSGIPNNPAETFIKVGAGAILSIPTNSTLKLGIMGQCMQPTALVDVDSSISFENMQIYGFGLCCGSTHLNAGTGDIINVAKTLTLEGGFRFTWNIFVQGDVITTAYHVGAGSITMNGPGTQTLTQSGSASLPTTYINKPGSVVEMSSDILVNDAGADFSLLNGTLNVNGLTLTASNSSGTDNVITFAAGTTVNFGGGSYSAEATVTAGSTINP